MGRNREERVERIGGHRTKEDRSGDPLYGDEKTLQKENSERLDIDGDIWRWEGK
jgi:hypothetical protein